jgi:hypothetical protein
LFGFPVFWVVGLGSKRNFGFIQRRGGGGGFRGRFGRIDEHLHFARGKFARFAVNLLNRGVSVPVSRCAGSGWSIHNSRFGFVLFMNRGQTSLRQLSSAQPGNGGTQYAAPNSRRQCGANCGLC